VRETHMVLEMGQLGESLAANIAGERFLAGVYELMSLQFGGCGKFFAAVRAFMPSVVLCGIAIWPRATPDLKVKW